MFQLFGTQTRELYFQLHSNKFRMHFDAAFEGAFELGKPSSLRCDAFYLRMQPELLYASYQPHSVHGVLC